MGCCVSAYTSKKTSAQDLPSNSKHNRTPQPSHPFLEEESVKEVLTETPSLPKKPTIVAARHQNHDPKNLTSSLLSDIPKNPNEKLKTHVENVPKKPITVFNHPVEISEEASEICSTLSETVSTATYFTEKNNDDDDGTHNRQRSFRHFQLSGDSRRERVLGRSPSKRSEPSPGRVRPGSYKDARGLDDNHGQRRDCGERSGRRSRSPATRTDGNGSKTGLVRSGSARKTGGSPGRVKSEVGDKIRKEDPSSNFSTSGRVNKWAPTSNETLENPLVSLECFIFL